MPTAEQLVRYREDGFVVLSGHFAAEEVARWGDECDRLWRAMATNHDADRIQFRGDTAGSRVADRIDPVDDVSPMFAALAADPRIVAAATALFGAPASLMKAKLITKRPGTMGYLSHQDHPYWAHLGVSADRMLSVQVSIDPATAENGALEVFPALHHERLPAPAHAPLEVDEAALDLADGRVMASKAGDLLFFHSLVPHRSGPNRATLPRRTLYLTYTAGTGAAIYDIYRASKVVHR